MIMIDACSHNAHGPDWQHARPGSRPFNRQAQEKSSSENDRLSEQGGKNLVASWRIAMFKIRSSLLLPRSLT